MTMQSLKCVAVGDGYIGKNAMFLRYKNDEFKTEYIPIVAETHEIVVELDDEVVKINVWELAGQEDYDRLRNLHYPNTNIFLICFKVVAPPSFYNVKARWIPELKRHNPKTPILLVGLQTDLRTDEECLNRLKEQGEEPITKEQGIKLAKEIKAVKYVECSAKTKEGLNEIFPEIALAGLQDLNSSKQKSNNTLCCEIL